MQQSDPEQIQLQRAVAFFRHPDRIRLIEALYEKYIHLGSIGGQVRLQGTTPAERMELASFLKKRLSMQADLTVRLADVQKALNESSFACVLPDLLQAFFPERPHETNPQRREARSIVHEHFRAQLQMFASTLPAESRGLRWLLEGAHGSAWLFARYKNETTQEQAHILEYTRLIGQALNQLPPEQTYERLAIFAQRISGDPHFFDLNTTSGRLFFHALSDLAHLEQRGQGSEDTVSARDETLDQARETSLRQDHLRLLLYYDAGLLLDTISSHVAVFHLMHALDPGGVIDPWIEQTGERILLLPLRQLLTWQRVIPATPRLFVFENPQVFEEIIDTLVRQHSQDRGQLPTLICTAGWPSIAAMRLLSLLLTTQPENEVYYSGDFDVQGLRIAAHLQVRYPERCHLWRFDAAAYRIALHSNGAALTPTELHTLSTLPADLTELSTTMQHEGKKAYQEGITQLLLKDILHYSSRFDLY